MPCEVPEASGNSTNLLFKFDSQTVTTAKGCKTCGNTGKRPMCSQAVSTDVFFLVHVISMLKVFLLKYLLTYHKVFSLLSVVCGFQLI